MAEYIALIASRLGISMRAMLLLLLLLVVWEAVWTIIAMWKAAKNNHLVWFVIFSLVNLLAIPEIVYLIVTRKKKSKSRAKKRRK